MANRYLENINLAAVRTMTGLGDKIGEISEEEITVV